MRSAHTQCDHHHQPGGVSMRFSQVLSLSVCAVVLAFPSFSAHAAKDVDKTIAVQLDDIGYKYEVDSDGDYVLQMQLENDRKQLEIGRASSRERWCQYV